MEASGVLGNMELDSLDSNKSAKDAWKGSVIEMVNMITNGTKPLLIKDYNKLLLENRDFKKQYKMAISALDSIISEKNEQKEKVNNQLKSKDVMKQTEQVGKCEAGNKINDYLEELQEPTVDSVVCNNSNQERNPCNNEKSFGLASVNECMRLSDFKKIRKKFDTDSSDKTSSEETSLPSSPTKETKHLGKSLNTKCWKEKSFHKEFPKKNRGESMVAVSVTGDNYKFKRELEEANQNNKILRKDLLQVKAENEELRDHIHSLELSLKTLTEAINLQDEQLMDYGSIVTSLKNSRSSIIDKMKDVTAKNKYNIMIMENIEGEISHLKRQLDTYNDLLTLENRSQIDKASSTEETLEEQYSRDEIIEKKDSYIAMLQDRLCEAIVDLKSKDSEIQKNKNHIKSLINNYDAEKKCLEKRLNSVNKTNEKLEENKIKQQETMKQLMKLIEFLQTKLENRR